MVHHMITRSKSKRTVTFSEISNDNNENLNNSSQRISIVSLIKNIQDINKELIKVLKKNNDSNKEFNFDEASLAWMSNKIKIGNGEYKYK